VLTRLGGEGKRSILQFVSEAGLIQGQRPVVSLVGADLRRAHVYSATLSTAKLSKADLSKADLSNADLSGADLSFAYLYKANLNIANLSGADLSGAILSFATLAFANLNGANLSGAQLAPPLGHLIIQEDQLPDTLKRKLGEVPFLGAAKNDGVNSLNALEEERERERYATRVTMREVERFGVELSGADLTGTNLRGAKGDIHGSLVARAKSLEGATMPNGQKYEEWVKSSEGQEWFNRVVQEGP
jgi:uncharacterized protein YjbI with pentapeptide repeats